MAKRVLNKKVTVKGKVINIGIDVHKSSWRVTDTFLLMVKVYKGSSWMSMIL